MGKYFLFFKQFIISADIFRKYSFKLLTRVSGWAARRFVDAVFPTCGNFSFAVLLYGTKKLLLIGEMIQQNFSL